MAKMTKVFGAIFCVLGTIYLTVSTFLYLNTSAHLDYNAEKPMSFIQSGTPFYFMVSILILGFGIILAKDKVIHNDHH
jgi:dipeptide/tripeptide permease